MLASRFHVAFRPSMSLDSNSATIPVQTKVIHAILIGDIPSKLFALCALGTART